MPQYDEPLEALERRLPSAKAPSDLFQFWSRGLSESRAVTWSPVVEMCQSGLSVIDVFDVTFAGFEGTPVRAWLRRPAGSTGDLPVIVQFAGYSGGRGLAHQASVWSLAGYAEFFVDTRGQGAGGGWTGDTEDTFGAGPTAPGFMTRGIQSPESYYYRRVITDAVLAVDAVRSIPGLDSQQIVLSGTSQGAGIALAAASLADNITGVMANVPFLCDFPRSLALAAAGPYLEIAGFLATNRWDAARVLKTLSYFDAATLVANANASSIFSVALADTTCPPSSVYAAYNSYAGPKTIRVYPFNDHEGGQMHQEAEQLTWLHELLSSPAAPEERNHLSHSESSFDSNP